MLNTVFLGSPPFARTILEGLIGAYGRPSLVVTQGPKIVGRGQKMQSTAVGEFAKSAALPLLETDNINATHCLDQIKAVRPDVLVVIAFGQLLKEELLKTPKYYPINLHGSLLPAYRGAAPMQWAIWNGEKVTGVTVQRMVKRLDAGEIVIQKEIPIGASDSSGDLLRKMAPIGAELLLAALNMIEAGSVQLIPQDESKATFAPKLDKSHGQIDWNRTAEQIKNQVRATLPWPACEIAVSDLRLKVLGVDVVEGSGEPATVYSDGKTFLHIQCGSGRLALTVIQPANKNSVNIAHFMRGFRGSFPSKLEKTP